MLETLQLRCPSCSTQLQIRGEPGQSLQVRCSSCGETLALTVPAPPTTQTPVSMGLPSQSTPPSQPVLSSQPVVSSQSVSTRPVRPATTAPLETVYRPPPSGRSSLNPVWVAGLIAAFVGTGLVAITIGVLVWLFQPGSDPVAEVEPWRRPAASRLPNEALRWKSTANVPERPALDDRELASVSGLDHQGLIDEYFQFLMRTHRVTQTGTFDQQRAALLRQNAKAELLLMRAIALRTAPRSMQADFDSRLESFEDKTQFTELFDSFQATSSGGALDDIELLWDWMKTPFFGLSIADDQIPILRYVRYVRTLRLAVNTLSEIKDDEQADAAAAKLQSYAQKVIEYAADQMNGISREGTQIDHPVSEDVFKRTIQRMGNRLRQQGITSLDLTLAQRNLEFAIEQVRSGKWLQSEQMIQAFAQREKPASATESDGQVASATVSGSLVSGKPGASMPRPETPSQFGANQSSDDVSASERQNRLSDYKDGGAKRIVIEGVGDEGIEALRAYLYRLQITDFFINRRGSIATIHLHDKRTITGLAGEIDFGRVTMISMRKNEVNVRFNNATALGSESPSERSR